MRNFVYAFLLGVLCALSKEELFVIIKDHQWVAIVLLIGIGGNAILDSALIVSRIMRNIRKYRNQKEWTKKIKEAQVTLTDLEDVLPK